MTTTTTTTLATRTSAGRGRERYYRLVRPEDGEGDDDDGVVDGCGFGFEWKRGERGGGGGCEDETRLVVADLDSARRATTRRGVDGNASGGKNCVARALDFTSIVESGARLVDDEDSVVTDENVSSSKASSEDEFVGDNVSSPRTLREALEAVDIAARSARERRFDIDSVKALVTEFSAVRRAVGIDAGWRYEEDEEDARVARELRVKADRANLEARIAEAEAEMLRREADDAHESFKATYGEDAWVDPLSREVDAWHAEASNRLAEIEPRRSAFAGMRYADLTSSLTISEPVSWLHLEESPTKRPLTSYSV
jgi:hypothetical protein